MLLRIGCFSDLNRFKLSRPTAAAPLLHRCCTAAAPLLRRCCTAAAPLLHRCCTAVGRTQRGKLECRERKRRFGWNRGAEQSSRAGQSRAGQKSSRGCSSSSNRADGTSTHEALVPWRARSTPWPLHHALFHVRAQSCRAGRARHAVRACRVTRGVTRGVTRVSRGCHAGCHVTKDAAREQGHEQAPRAVGPAGRPRAVT